MSDKRNYVVVAGWLNDEGRSEMIQSLGAFRSVDVAYGKAYLFLSEIADNDNDTITLPFELEGDTGFGIVLKNPEGKSKEYAYILFNKDNEEERDEDGDEWQ